jgi:hypothetical protein
LSSGLGVIIAKRSISLSKSYFIIGIFMASLSILISNIPHLIGTGGNLPVNTTGTSLNLTQAMPLVSVALQVFAAILFSTSVILLYVYDKNNGVLEYFLSLGMDQQDVYRQYLKAALILASGIVCFEVIINVAAGLLGGTSELILIEASVLVVIIALPVVCFQTLLMMSFSSLQKQRIGSNQPLGVAIGVFMVMPAYIIPLVLPSIAIQLDLTLAAIIGILFSLMYLSSSRLISREKLLP